MRGSTTTKCNKAELTRAYQTGKVSAMHNYVGKEGRHWRIFIVWSQNLVWERVDREVFYFCTSKYNCFIMIKFSFIFAFFAFFVLIKIIIFFCLYHFENKCTLLCALGIMKEFPLCLDVLQRIVRSPDLRRNSPSLTSPFGFLHASCCSSNFLWVITSVSTQVNGEMSLESWWTVTSFAQAL